MHIKMWLFIFAFAVICAPLKAESKPAARPVARPARGSAAPSNTKNTAAYTGYLTRLRGKLLNNWNVPNGKNKVILTTLVSADGTVGDLGLSSTPKNADGEIAGSEAFAKSQPLEAIPGGGQVKLILTFESSADPHGDSSSNVYTQIVPVPVAKTAPAPADAAPPADASTPAQ
ncbi:hypothetical protein BH10CYA1_BH10CYA1_10110 [soil metagenome]